LSPGNGTSIRVFHPVEFLETHIDQAQSRENVSYVPPPHICVSVVNHLSVALCLGDDGRTPLVDVAATVVGFGWLSHDPFLERQQIAIFRLIRKVLHSVLIEAT